MALKCVISVKTTIQIQKCYEADLSNTCQNIVSVLLFGAVGLVTTLTALCHRKKLTRQLK